MDFVVDTGATHIAFNLSTAKRLGIDYENGRPSWTSTANGVKEVRLVTLDKVSVGSLTYSNIMASVSLDDALPVILLGNSFLQHVDLRKQDGVLILEDRAGSR